MPDPGNPEEKKKLVIIGVLGLLMVGIGAFQFLPSAPAEPAKKPTTASGQATQLATATYTPDTIGTVALNGPSDLDPRDPFEPDPTLIPHDPADKTLVPPVVRPTLKHETFPEAGPIRPLPLPGSVPSNVPNSAPESSPEPVVANPGLRLAGVVDGPHQLAILVDTKGTQQLVEVGSSIDGESRLLAIGHQEALILFRGKSLRLKTGGNPIEK